MFIASVSVKNKNELRKFKGIKECKQLNNRQVETWFEKIDKSKVKWAVEEATAAEISRTGAGYPINLNDLEARKVGKLIRKNCHTTDGRGVIFFLDNWETTASGFLKRMQKNCPDIITMADEKKIKIVSEHDADCKYRIVAMASVVAKYHADKQMKLFRKKFGDIGSGNPNDSKTIRFLSEHVNHKKECDGCKIIRKSWVTWQRLVETGTDWKGRKYL